MTSCNTFRTHRRCVGCILFLFACTLASTSLAYNWHTSGRPQMDRRAIAGLWRLTSLPKPPLKEFTVYPKKPTQDQNDIPELLLMLKEDGSFLQCSSNDRTEQDESLAAAEVDVDASWSKFQKQQMSSKAAFQTQVLHGTWDYRDGKLILAADRPEGRKTVTDDIRQSSRRQGRWNKEKSSKKQLDTLLVGRVVATYETKLQDNPALQTAEEQPRTETDETVKDAARKQQPRSKVALDTHLSVPKGSVKVGRFFYPRNHPSFFDQPMFQPTKQGSFSLSQVLGALNTGVDQEHEQVVEKFHRSDFYNKTFLLTSHPIGFNKQPKGRLRWSIRQNKMVHDPPSKQASKAAHDQESRPANIRVMQVQFHANNTFSTVAGLGESILRGKFDVIGNDKDQLWMQVWRFGFGRSVSGSVYSEGRMLTHEDAKMYWGTIRYEEEEKESVDATPGEIANESEENLPPELNQEKDVAKNSESRLEVKGSVMLGSGLEPMPVARFIMREMTSEEMHDDEDEEDEDDELEGPAGYDEGGIDWSSGDSSFQ